MLQHAGHLPMIWESNIFILQNPSTVSWTIVNLELMTSEFEMAELLVVFLMPFKRCIKRFKSNADKLEIDYVFFVQSY
jgi:hypothetical protein